MAEGAGDRGGVDPGVIAAGRQAGVSEAQLKKLEALVAKPNAMTDQPRARLGRRGVLSESEDEEEAGEVAGGDDGVAAGDGAPVEQAVIQLTKLVSQLSKQRTRPKGIEGIFEKQVLMRDLPLVQAAVEAKLWLTRS